MHQLAIVELRSDGPHDRDVGDPPDLIASTFDRRRERGIDYRHEESENFDLRSDQTSSGMDKLNLFARQLFNGKKIFLKVFFKMFDFKNGC